MAITEKTWLKTDRAALMIDHLKGMKGAVSERKLRLALCACLRPLAAHFAALPRRTFEAAEKFAEESTEPLRKKMTDLGATLGSAHFFGINVASEGASRKVLMMAVYGVRTLAYANVWKAATDLLERAGWEKYSTKPWCDVLRCVFGNPFRPVQADPLWLDWNGGTVPRLARAIYDGRSFEQYPILADALEDAGCTDEAILEHLRSPGPHDRGCWALDLCLEKDGAPRRGWARLREMAQSARLGVFQPHPAWLITVADDVAADDHPAGTKALAEHNLHLFPAPVPQVALAREFDPKKLRKDKRVRSVDEVWLITSEDRVRLPAAPAGRLVDSRHGQALLYVDRVQALRDLAQGYSPVALLLRLHDEGFAEAGEALQGRPGAVALLSDELDRAGRGEAKRVCLLEAATQHLRGTQGLSGTEADFEREVARLDAETEPCAGCGALGRRGAGRLEETGRDAGRLFIRCDGCGRFEWYDAASGAVEVPERATAPRAAKAAPKKPVADDEDDAALARLQAQATPCPQCGKKRRAMRVKKEGPNKGRLFLRCSDWSCEGFEWAPAGDAAPAAKPASPAPVVAGDAVRAELTHVQAELAKGDDADLRARERELLAAHARGWMGPLYKHLRDAAFEGGRLVVREVTGAGVAKHLDRIFVETPVRSLHVRVDGWQQVKAATQPALLSRLDELILSGNVGGKGAEVLAQARDLIHLRVLRLWSRINRQGLEALFASPYLARLTALDLRNSHLSHDTFKLVGTCPYLGNLTSLRLSGCGLGDKEVRSLAESPYLRRLTELDLLHSDPSPEALAALLASPNVEHLTALTLGSDDLGPNTARALAACTSLTQLEQLTFCGSHLGDGAARALARWAPLARLRVLRLSANEITEEGAAFLAAVKFARLTELDLSQNLLCDEGARALADCRHLGAVASLDLTRSLIEEEGLAALLASRHLTGVTNLMLSQNLLGPAGAERLVGSPRLARLTSLGLGETRLGLAGLRALAAAKGAAVLRSLDLSGNELGDEGARMLAASPHLGGLRRLRLRANGLTADGVAALLASPHLRELTALDLMDNRLGDEGARVLASSPRSGQLDSIDLREMTFTEAGWRALLDSPHLYRPCAVWVRRYHTEQVSEVTGELAADPRIRIADWGEQEDDAD